MRLRCAVLVLLVLVALTHAVRAGEHDGVLYTTPAGWSEQTEGTSKMFTPPDVTPGEVVVAIITGAAPAGGDPAKVFEASVVNALQGVRVTGSSPVTTSIRGAGTFLVQAHHVEAADLGGHLQLHAMVIDGRKRVFAVVIVKPESILARYQPAIATLLESLSFVGGTPPH